MKTKYLAIMMAACLWMVATPAAFAQPCTPSYPEVVLVGESHCIQLCAGSFIAIELHGNLDGPEAIPVLIMDAGCQTEHCNVVCTPIAPPEGLEFGGDPFFPEDWYGESDCIIIYEHWVHDGVWSFEIFSFCQGCFCLTFDRQLSAELASFSAVAGDGAVTLNWSTNSEVNNDRFQINRDGETVADVPATNSISGGSYSWTDRDVRNGTTYTYTLVSLSLDGSRSELASETATPNLNNAVITEYALHQNYPNPFNPSTSIAFDLVQQGNAKVVIYNVLGETVATLVNGTYDAGRHTVTFNGANLSSGVYLYKLEANGFTDTKKLVLLK